MQAARLKRMARVAGLDRYSRALAAAAGTGPSIAALTRDTTSASFSGAANACRPPRCAPRGEGRGVGMGKKGRGCLSLARRRARGRNPARAAREQGSWGRAPCAPLTCCRSGLATAGLDAAAARTAVTFVMKPSIGSMAILVTPCGGEIGVWRARRAQSLHAPSPSSPVCARPPHQACTRVLALTGARGCACSVPCAVRRGPTMMKASHVALSCASRSRLLSLWAATTRGPPRPSICTTALLALSANRETSPVCVCVCGGVQSVAEGRRFGGREVGLAERNRNLPNLLPRRSRMPSARQAR